jgi:hypothetical protein
VKRRIQRELDRTEVMETEFYLHREYAFLSPQEVQQKIDKRLHGPGESPDYPIVLIIGHATPVIIRPLTILSLRGNDHHTITHS